MRRAPSCWMAMPSPMRPPPLAPFRLCQPRRRRLWISSVGSSVIARGLFHARQLPAEAPITVPQVVLYSRPIAQDVAAAAAGDLVYHVGGAGPGGAGFAGRVARQTEQRRVQIGQRAVEWLLPIGRLPRQVAVDDPVLQLQVGHPRGAFHPRGMVEAP